MVRVLESGVLRVLESGVLMVLESGVLRKCSGLRWRREEAMGKDG